MFLFFCFSFYANVLFSSISFFEAYLALTEFPYLVSECLSRQLVAYFEFPTLLNKNGSRFRERSFVEKLLGFIVPGKILVGTFQLFLTLIFLITLKQYNYEITKAEIFFIYIVKIVKTQLQALLVLIRKHGSNLRVLEQGIDCNQEKKKV